MVSVTCLLALDSEMNSFSDEERLSGSISNRLIDAAHVTNS